MSLLASLLPLVGDQFSLRDIFSAAAILLPILLPLFSIPLFFLRHVLGKPQSRSNGFLYVTTLLILVLVYVDGIIFLLIYLIIAVAYFFTFRSGLCTNLEPTSSVSDQSSLIDRFRSIVKTKIIGSIWAGALMLLVLFPPCQNTCTRYAQPGNRVLSENVLFEGHLAVWTIDITVGLPKQRTSHRSVEEVCHIRFNWRWLILYLLALSVISDGIAITDFRKNWTLKEFINAQYRILRSRLRWITLLLALIGAEVAYKVITVILFEPIFKGAAIPEMLAAAIGAVTGAMFMGWFIGSVITLIKRDDENFFKICAWASGFAWIVGRVGNYANMMEKVQGY